MDLKETTIEKNVMYDGKIITVRSDKALAPSGNEVPREVVVHPGGVGIAMEDAEGKFFLVTQFRYAQQKIMTEFPAGKKEPGEDPLMTAMREIIEETGYEGTEFIHLGSLCPTPAYDTEVIDMYYTKQGKYLGQHLDDDENLNLSKMTLEEIADAIVRGNIDDAKTVAMTFLIKEMKERNNG